MCVCVKQTGELNASAAVSKCRAAAAAAMEMQLQNQITRAQDAKLLPHTHIHTLLNTTELN